MNGVIASTATSSTMTALHGRKYPGYVSIIPDGYCRLYCPIFIADRDLTN
jgi:hypothetical protein